MSDCEDYRYLDVILNLHRNSDAVVTAAYFQGSIENSLRNLFGEIGGQTELELVDYSQTNNRAILRAPAEFITRIHVAIILIGKFQGVPCYFKVVETSKKPLELKTIVQQY